VSYSLVAIWLNDVYWRAGGHIMALRRTKHLSRHIILGYFPEKYHRAIDCSGTDNQTCNNKEQVHKNRH